MISGSMGSPSQPTKPKPQMAATTLGGIQQALVEGLNEFVRVLPAEQLKSCAEG